MDFESVTSVVVNETQAIRRPRWRGSLSIYVIFFYTNPVHGSNNDIQPPYRAARHPTPADEVDVWCDRHGISGSGRSQLRDHACTHRRFGAFFHSRTDAGLRVKRLKELSSSAELVLVETL